MSSMNRLRDARVLMYSHDTFGLGHLRRCRAIAHALVDRFKGISVLIVSGSQIAGAFEFRARVDFVKIPSVIKLYSGEYTSIGKHIDLEETMRMREALILETTRHFAPDIIIVDKEPLGLRGEMEPTLVDARRRGVHTVLGLRDVMDAPDALAEEWTKKAVTPKMATLYDEVWIYGPEGFNDPLAGIDLPRHLRRRCRYTGFLRRGTPAADVARDTHPGLPEDYILVTAGGGGDGYDVMSWVLGARELDRNLVFRLALVPGPFMAADRREEVHRRAANLAAITVIDFDTSMEALMLRARAVVGMCGYNTFCECLSFDRPALFVPRTVPRLEQAIRAERAQELGWARLLEAERASQAPVMADALHALPQQPPPSASSHPVALDGLEFIAQRVETLIERAPAMVHPRSRRMA